MTDCDSLSQKPNAKRKEKYDSSILKLFALKNPDGEVGARAKEGGTDDGVELFVWFFGRSEAGNAYRKRTKGKGYYPGFNKI